MKLVFYLCITAICIQSCSKDNLTNEVLNDTINEEPIIENAGTGTLSIDAFLKDPITISTGRALTLEEAIALIEKNTPKAKRKKVTKKK